MKTRAKIRTQVGKQRYGRGFSRDELRKAGLCFKDALRLKIPIDSMRRTTHDENVEAVKAFAAEAKASAKPKVKPKSRTRAKQDT